MVPTVVMLAHHLSRTNHHLMGPGLEEDVRWRRWCVRDLVMDHLRLHPPQTGGHPRHPSRPYEPRLGRAVGMALEHPVRLSLLEARLPAATDPLGEHCCP